eukprot:6696258-Pyramimonas_sp.AAC.1
MLKLYRDFRDSEYHKWRACPTSEPCMVRMREQMAMKPPGGEDAPEDEEEETPEAWVKRLNLEWRLRAVGLWSAGEAAEDVLTKEVAAVSTYDGKRDAKGFRHDKASRSYYPNGDVYWGEYRDTYRTGTGYYLFAGGSSYKGSFLDGNFEKGETRHPDSSVYTGDHKGCLQVTNTPLLRC